MGAGLGGSVVRQVCPWAPSALAAGKGDACWETRQQPTRSMGVASGELVFPLLSVCTVMP